MKIAVLNIEPSFFKRFLIFIVGLTFMPCCVYKSSVGGEVLLKI